jgi:acyl-CoA dehydrogenase
LSATTFFEPVDYPEIPRRSEAGDDGYLFRQKTGGLAGVRFPDYRLAYAGVDLRQCRIFGEQVELFRTLLIKAPPTAEQAANIDYMLAAGQLFTLIVYAQLILENARSIGSTQICSSRSLPSWSGIFRHLPCR